MNQITIDLCEPIFIINFLNSANPEKINNFSNKDYSKKNALVFNIPGESFVILIKNLSEVSCIKNILSNLKGLISFISCSNLKNINYIIRDENSSDQDINILSEIEILEDFNINIYLNKLNNSNEDFYNRFLKNIDSYRLFKDQVNQIDDIKQIEDLIQELYDLLKTEFIKKICGSTKSKISKYGLPQKIKTYRRRK